MRCWTAAPSAAPGAAAVRGLRQGLVNQRRDSYYSYPGHLDLFGYFAIAENESKARVCCNLTAKMLQPRRLPANKRENGHLLVTAVWEPLLSSSRLPSSPRVSAPSRPILHGHVSPAFLMQKCLHQGRPA